MNNEQEKKLTNAEINTIAREIAKSLGERNYGFISQVRRIIRFCGVEFAREMYTVTQEVEANGGLMTVDNSRRRTPGGVYCNLIRHKVPAELWKKISYDKSKSRYIFAKWKKRIEMIEKLQVKQGKAKAVRVSLKGRPEQIEKGREFVTLLFPDTASRHNLQAPLPLPPTTPILITIYVPLETWAKVEQAFTTTSDNLIIDGICVFDAETGTVRVYASLIKMKALKRPPTPKTD